MASPENTNYLAPADQLASVHEVAERLFPAYTIDGGSIHLAGCRLEERLFLKLRSVATGCRYVDASCRPVEERLVESLGLVRTVPWIPPPEMAPERLATAIASSTALAEQRYGGGKPIEVTAIWCKHAEGKLRFTIADHSTDLAFAGWTAALEPPPFVCPCTGASTFHVAATDDGRIVAAEQLAVCAESGRRVLADELVVCDATAARVLPEFTAVCPVSGGRVLGRVMTVCSLCAQSVSPRAIESGSCEACRSTRAVTRQTAPALDRLIEEHPRLARWSQWKAAGTAEVQIFVARRWWKRLLLVVDNDRPNIRHAAVARRFATGFTPIAVDQIDSFA